MILNEEESEMTITREMNGTTMTFRIEGSLDTLTAPALMEEREKDMDGADELILDFQGVPYISSAGLRAVLGAYKQMNGRLKLIHVSEILMEVLEVTGLNETLTIE